MGCATRLCENFDTQLVPLTLCLWNQMANIALKKKSVVN